MVEPAILALEDGTVFTGSSVGKTGRALGEVVFNTATTGYQEILTDPSYCRQLVTLTYPHIGNVGTNSEDMESDRAVAAGLIVRDLSSVVSNWRSGASLADFLCLNNVVAISDIDTRKLTRIIRDKGAQAGCILSGSNIDSEEAVKAAQEFPGLKGMDLAQVVSTKDIYEWSQGSSWEDRRAASSHADSSFNVVAFDFGVKRNILRLLKDEGCSVTVVPAKTSADEVMRLRPDGVFLSNGPGDPEPCKYAIHAIQELLNAEIPIFGICLGHQLLALASGANTVKMKFGHHGANHPVVDLKTEQVMITSQNHGFAVDEESLLAHTRATHRSLFDGSLQGIERIDRPAFSFQGHPEASPGPHDIKPLFGRFIELMEVYKGLKK